MASSHSTQLRRFWARVNKTDTCWLWTGAKGRDGYGVVSYDYKTVGAHRYSYIQAHGPIPRGLFVLHRCDVPNCVRPDHLFLGTQLDNMRDRNTKGRANMPHSERHWNSRLTADQIAHIRRLVQAGETQTSLAPKFGCSPATINRVVNGQTWAERHGAAG